MAALGSLRLARRRGLTMLAALAFLAPTAVQSYLLPGTFPTHYKRGEVLYADASTLVSSESDLQFPYHALPICTSPPPLPDEEEEAEEEEEDGGNPRRRRAAAARRPASAAPYAFSVMVDTRTASACPGPGQRAAPPLTPAKAAYLAAKIRAHYRVRLALDGLPALVAGGGSAAAAGGPTRPGFDLGFTRNGTSFINNHLLFRVRAHRISSGGGGQKKQKKQAGAVAALLGGGRKGGPGGGTDGPPASPAATTTGAPGDAWLIVAFDVLACSIARPPPPRPGQAAAWADVPCAVGPAGAPPDPQPVTPGASIAFTYDILWEAAPGRGGPAARWDAYLGPAGGGGALLARAHWLALANAALALAALGGAAGGLLARTVRSDVARYRAGRSGGAGASARGSSAFFEGLAGLGKDGEDGGVPGPPPDGGWRAVSGDVFRAPPAAEALAARFGAGVQVGVALGGSLAGAVLGAAFPSVRPSVPAIAAAAALAGSAAAGAAAVWLRGAATRSHAGWAGVAWRAGAHFPVPALAALALLNAALHRAGAAGALPPAALAAGAGAWAATCLPLALLGGAAAARRPPLAPPARTNQIPRHVPPPPWGARPALLWAASAVLPFGACLLEARHAALAAWQGYSYAAFAFAAATALAATAIVALGASITVYAQLCGEDYRWWWAAHGRGGAGAWAGAAYAGVAGLAALPGLLAATGGGPAAAAGVALYVTYCGLGLWAAHLAGGAVGLGASLAFVRSLFAAVKAD